MNCFTSKYLYVELRLPQDATCRIHCIFTEISSFTIIYLYDWMAHTNCFVVVLGTGWIFHHIELNYREDSGTFLPVQLLVGRRKELRLAQDVSGMMARIEATLQNS